MTRNRETTYASHLRAGNGIAPVRLRAGWHSRRGMGAVPAGIAGIRTKAVAVLQ
ncbi:MAG: hypothetical protein U1F10_03655 [Burkholderiales bacterium]